MRRLGRFGFIGAVAGLLCLTSQMVGASTIDGFYVRDVKAGSGITVNSVAVAKLVLSGATTTAGETDGVYSTINFNDGSAAYNSSTNTSGLPYYSTAVAFPGGSGRDQYAVLATGVLTIATAGSYTFGVNTDDGFELKIGDAVLGTQGDKGASNQFFTYTFATAGSYNISFLMYEDGGLSNMELFAAQGTYTSFDASAFHLVGDTANGGLAVAVPEPGTLAMVGLGLLGFLAFVWRKRKNR